MSFWASFIFCVLQTKDELLPISSRRLGPVLFGPCGVYVFRLLICSVDLSNGWARLRSIQIYRAVIKTQSPITVCCSVANKTQLSFCVCDVDDDIICAM